MTRRTERTVLPLLPRREERGGERRGIFARVSPLPNPLPARSSRGEGEDSLSPNRLIQWQCSRPGTRDLEPGIVGKDVSAMSREQILKLTSLSSCAG